LGDIGQI
jgi:ribA/ribD-fused uncharacterized protein